METERSPAKDHRATEPPAEERPEQKRDRGSKERQGGPKGNPEVDEETLRKKQEEARNRRQEGRDIPAQA